MGGLNLKQPECPPCYITKMEYQAVLRNKTQAKIYLYWIGSLIQEIFLGWLPSWEFPVAGILPVLVPLEALGVRRREATLFALVGLSVPKCMGFNGSTGLINILFIKFKRSLSIVRLIRSLCTLKARSCRASPYCAGPTPMPLWTIYRTGHSDAAP